MLPNALSPPSAAPLQPGDLVDEREAAAILSISVQTLRNWRWKHCGPKVKTIGIRMVRYYRTDLAAFIEGKADTA